jgi:hypothetical protein
MCTKLHRAKTPSTKSLHRSGAELAAMLAVADALRRLSAETGADLDALFPALLGRAFKGELKYACQ